MIIIIFGGSGDLTLRKLLPSLNNIDLSKIKKIITFSRTKYTTQEYIKKIKKNGEIKKQIIKRIEYISGEYDEIEKIKEITQIENENIIYYLSVPPLVYPTILNKLNTLPHGKVLIEKPYGSNIYEFNDIKKFMLENKDYEVLLIDHYLLKEVMLAYNVINNDQCKKETSILIPFNNKTVKKINIISKEILGGEGRAFFDEYGIIMDLIQTHLLELLLVVLGRNNKEKDTNEISAVEIAKNLKVDTNNIVLGQYNSYTTELNKHSDTETYAMIPIYSTSKFHKEIEIKLSAGKGMNEKLTEIEIELTDKGIDQIVNKYKRFNDDKNELVRDEIKTMFFILNIYPSKSIFLRIINNNSSYNVILYNSDTIMSIKDEYYGKDSNYGLVFDMLLRDQEVPAVSVYEAYEIWKMFSGWSKNKEEMFFYEKGSESVKKG